MGSFLKLLNLKFLIFFQKTKFKKSKFILIFGFFLLFFSKVVETAVQDLIKFWNHIIFNSGE